MNTRVRFTFYVLTLALLITGCSDPISTEVTGTFPVLQDEDAMMLKDAAPFPVGNIWAAGHPTWGDSKGTDLGGPSNIWAPEAFGPLSTIIQKDLELPLEDDLIIEQFSSITPEVALKPHNISVSPDSIDFREADAMMLYAESNGLRVHGHVLLFEKSVPQWALEYEAAGTWTEQQWEEWLEWYIQTVVGRYAGRIAAWDVANEIGMPFGGGLNQQYFWRKVIGDDFLEKAFRWAHEADPDAKLFINDFAIGFFHDKLRDILDVADGLRAQGLQVDGIGFQGHIVIPFFQGGYERNKAAYRMAADRGYLVHVSELDIAVNFLGSTDVQTPLQHRIQRKRYNDISRAYLDGVPPEKQWGITLWNISDRNSFYNTVKIWFDLRLLGGDKDYPMLWDEDYLIKPAYFGFRNGLRGIYEGWAYPDLYDTSRDSGEAGQAAEWLSLKEAQEMNQYLTASKRMMMEYFRLSESEADQLVDEAVNEMNTEGLRW